MNSKPKDRNLFKPDFLPCGALQSSRWHVAACLMLNAVRVFMSYVRLRNAGFRDLGFGVKGRGLRLPRVLSVSSRQYRDKWA